MRIRPLVIITLLFSFLAASCGYVDLVDSGQKSAVDVNETLAVIAARETMLAMPTQTAIPSDTPVPATIEPKIFPTFTAPPTQTPSLTYTPTLPTATPTVTLTPSITPTPTNTYTMSPLQKTEAAYDRIKSANVLIFEDIVGNTALIPRVDKALEGLRFSGGTVINTRDAMGNFSAYLESDVNWDLVIISLEHRDYLNNKVVGTVINHMENNGALIVEFWNLDEDVEGPVWYLLDECGLRVQHDWWRPQPYKDQDFYISPLSNGSPVFWYPNEIDFPLKPTVYWMGDVGDWLMLPTGSDATLLAGLQNDDDKYGVLASCAEGRVLVQTFSTHDYSLRDTIMLWQNYIVYTLSNHYNAIEN